MQTAEIEAVFNARHEGDSFTGLNSSVKGRTTEKRHNNLHAFLKDAGRDYKIIRVPSYVKLPQEMGFAEADDSFHLVRDRDFRVVDNGTVTAQYDPLSLMDIADEMQPFCDQGWASPDGVYDRNGSLEILSLRLDYGGEMPDGEKMVHYVVLVNPHGLGKAQGKIISFRIVCANTFAAAVSANYDFAISHRKARNVENVMKERFATCVKTWDSLQAKIGEMSKKIQTWDTTPLSVSDARGLTEKLLGIDGEKEEDRSTNAKNKRDFILANFGNAAIGTKGRTAWDFLNAVTYFTSNGQKNSKVEPIDRQVRNILTTGTGFKMESEALALVESLV